MFSFHAPEHISDVFEEAMMNETYLIPTVIDEAAPLPAEDDTAQLAQEEKRRRKEGKADDIIAMQAAVCMLIAAGVIITNIFRPDISGELFDRLCELSESESELFPNPIGLIMQLFGK